MNEEEENWLKFAKMNVYKLKYFWKKLNEKFLVSHKLFVHRRKIKLSKKRKHHDEKLTKFWNAMRTTGTVFLIFFYSYYYVK